MLKKIKFYIRDICYIITLILIFIISNLLDSNYYLVTEYKVFEMSKANKQEEIYSDNNIKVEPIKKIDLISYQYEPVIVLDNSQVKGYMDYRKITDTTSKQYNYINTSGEIHINEKGYLITDDNFIGVALGSYFGEIGTKYIFTLDTGIELKLVKVESKDDIDTCELGYLAQYNSIIEFVIDSQSEYMKSNIAPNSYIFQGNFNNCSDFIGKVINIKRVNNTDSIKC